MRGKSASSISFCTLLALIFITLRLIGVINWSWWWVSAPLWIPAAIAIPFVIIAVIISIVINIRDKKQTGEQ